MHWASSSPLKDWIEQKSKGKVKLSSLSLSRDIRLLPPWAISTPVQAFGLGPGLTPSAPLVPTPSNSGQVIPPTSLVLQLVDGICWDGLFSIIVWGNSHNKFPFLYACTFYWFSFSEEPRLIHKYYFYWRMFLKTCVLEKRVFCIQVFEGPPTHSCVTDIVQREVRHSGPRWREGLAILWKWWSMRLKYLPLGFPSSTEPMLLVSPHSNSW